MVFGGVMGGGERSAHTVFEYAVPATAFPGSAHYVALGHLHRAQRIAGACPDLVPAARRWRSTSASSTTSRASCWSRRCRARRRGCEPVELLRRTRLPHGLGHVGPAGRPGRVTATTPTSGSWSTRWRGSAWPTRSASSSPTPSTSGSSAPDRGDETVAVDHLPDERVTPARAVRRLSAARRTSTTSASSPCSTSSSTRSDSETSRPPMRPERLELAGVHGLPRAHRDRLRRRRSLRARPARPGRASRASSTPSASRSTASCPATTTVASSHPVISQGRLEARVGLDFAVADARYTAVRVVRGHGQRGHHQGGPTGAPAARWRRGARGHGR